MCRSRFDLPPPNRSLFSLSRWASVLQHPDERGANRALLLEISAARVYKPPKIDGHPVFRSCFHIAIAGRLAPPPLTLVPVPRTTVPRLGIGVRLAFASAFAFGLCLAKPKSKVEGRWSIREVAHILYRLSLAHFLPRVLSGFVSSAKRQGRTRVPSRSVFTYPILSTIFDVARARSVRTPANRSVAESVRTGEIRRLAGWIAFWNTDWSNHVTDTHGSSR